jgi:hypothetical protein
MDEAAQQIRHDLGVREDVLVGAVVFGHGRGFGTKSVRSGRVGRRRACAKSG